MPSTKSVSALSVGRGDLVLPYSVTQDISTLRQRVISVNSSFEEIDYLPCSGNFLSETVLDWEYSDSVYTQTSVAPTPYCYILLPGLPYDTTIRAVTVGFEGAGGHAALPANMPRAELYFGYVPFGAWASTGYSGVDTSPDTATYQVGHILAIDMAYGLVVESGKSYLVRLRGEYGADSLVGLTCTGIRVQCVRY